MEVTWIDKRLSWNASHYGGISSIIVPAEQLWLPDMALQNSANDIYHSSLVENKFRVSIYSDGSIFWVPGGKYYTNCELDISYFPFDDQKCELHFTNWAYNGNQMNLSVQASNISLDNYQVNGEWDIVTTRAHRQEKFYACCGDTPYPSIYFTIYMRRKYLFYITNIIAPCVMLSVLISLVFYLPPESGEKVSLGITCLLSCIVFLLLIAESIPKRSDSVPIISIYLAIFLTITTASICSTVVVLHVHHMGTKKVPMIVKRIVFDILARMLCLSELARKYGTSSCRHGDHEPMDSSMTSTMINSCKNPSMLGRQTSHRRSTNNGRISNNTNGGMKKSFSITDDRIAQHIMLNRNYVLEEILTHIKIFTQERSEHERIESTRQEWTAVAQVLDKFFMSVFMSSIACSTFFVLIMLPMSKVELASL
ncbi:neuronal acetylcholine receptor subunit alpha-10-like [Watersipora subatra]|uniref:neuronal acetylcholine receptor subunit alpha-10-like n=1 Tax=Watersipora subatra TaxID=2589382 RepID=UPI00355B0286